MRTSRSCVELPKDYKSAIDLPPKNRKENRAFFGKMNEELCHQQKGAVTCCDNDICHINTKCIQLKIGKYRTPVSNVTVFKEKSKTDAWMCFKKVEYKTV